MIVFVEDKAKNPRREGFIYAFTHPGSPRRVKIGWSKEESFGEKGRVEYLTFLMRSFQLPPVTHVASEYHPEAFQIEKRIAKLLRA